MKNSEIYFIKGGSGVEPVYFKNFKKKINKNIIMVSRIVSNKGVREFLFAAEILKTKYPDWNFILLGSEDYSSPDIVDKSYLNLFKKKR